MREMSKPKDESITLSYLKKRIQKFIDDRDWAKYHTPKSLAISVAIEASELLELFQWVKDTELDNKMNDPDTFRKLEEELADVLIYCLSLANVLDLDLATAVLKKIKKNESKYPIDQVKGNYKKYTELGGDVSEK